MQNPPGRKINLIKKREKEMKVNRDILSQIQTDYEHSDLTRKEICEKYGISSSTLSNYVKAFGFEPRQRHFMYPNKPEKNHTQTVLCTRCKKSVSVPGARFCPFCGEDIRSESMKVQDRLASLVELTSLMPENARDAFVKTIRDEIRLLGDSTEDEDAT